MSKIKTDELKQTSAAGHILKFLILQLQVIYLVRRRKFKAKVFYSMEPQWMKAELYMWQILELQGSWMTEYAYVGRMDGVFLESRHPGAQVIIINTFYL